MSSDFTPEQKRYLEGFNSGLQIARLGRGLGKASAAKPSGPDAEHLEAQDRVIAARAEMLRQTGDQGKAIAAQFSGIRGLHLLVGVLRDQPDPMIAPRRQPAMRAQVDRSVDRLRAVVKEIQGPDVECAARQIDPCRRR